jgi:hypothetical protein
MIQVNIFKKVMTENFPNLEKEMLLQVYKRLLGLQTEVPHLIL